MIRYRLVCRKKHEFESWFASSAAYDAQTEKGLVACPHCGTKKVEKALMAPNVSTSRRKRKAAAEIAQRIVEAGVEGPPAAPPAPAATADPTMIASPTPEQRAMMAALRKLREEVLARSEDVGPRFAEEARKIHYEEAEARSIYGQATLEDAEALLEEGIAIHPLPDLPDDRN